MNKANKITNIYLKNFVIKSVFKNIGLKLFRLGILLLAAAPSISFLVLLISSLCGVFSREDKFLDDKYNWLLILSSFLMILNCFFITFDYIKIPVLDKNLIWSFRIYLHKKCLSKSSNLFSSS